ncbi:MAG: NADP-dependent oxidoreductase [Thermoleophilaceae bacterium]|nr:NADP-dependent oxidoreductase [Thermoleophilaceae bacterium]
MKAYVVERYKHPIAAAEVAEPTAGDHDVIVEIHAAAVNVIDEKIRTGEFKLLMPYKAPFVLGHDLAGVVVAVGPKATRFSVGDEVFGCSREGKIGTFAERLAVHEDDLALKPSGFSMIDAASAPLVVLTAWQTLVEIADVQPGQKVFIQAGSGGVGTYAIQLAKHLGATVATTASAASKPMLTGLGADTVVDYKTENFEELLSGYDVAIDSLGGAALSSTLRILKPGGIAIGIAGPPDPAFARRRNLALPLRIAMSGLSFKVRRLAKRLGVSYQFWLMHEDGAQLNEIAGLLEAGTLRPVIDRTFSFEQTPEALEYVASGRSKGKVVIDVKERESS